MADEFAGGELVVAEVGTVTEVNTPVTVLKICRSKIGGKTYLAIKPYDGSEVSKVLLILYCNSDWLSERENCPRRKNLRDVQ